MGKYKAVIAGTGMYVPTGTLTNKDLEKIVEARRGKVADLTVEHGEDDPVITAQSGLLDPAKAQHLGTRPLGEIQIAAVIDDAGGIDVLIIDAHCKAVLARVDHFKRHRLDVEA